MIRSCKVLIPAVEDFAFTPTGDLIGSVEQFRQRYIDDLPCKGDMLLLRHPAGQITIDSLHYFCIWLEYDDMTVIKVGTGAKAFLRLQPEEALFIKKRDIPDVIPSASNPNIYQGQYFPDLTQAFLTMYRIVGGVVVSRNWAPNVLLRHHTGVLMDQVESMQATIRVVQVLQLLIFFLFLISSVQMIF